MEEEGEDEGGRKVEVEYRRSRPSESSIYAIELVAIKFDRLISIVSEGILNDAKVPSLPLPPDVQPSPRQEGALVSSATG